MGISATLTNTFLQPLQQGVSNFKSGYWQWIEVANSLQMAELFHSNLINDKLFSLNQHIRRSALANLILTSPWRGFALSLATRSAIQKITQNSTSNYLYIPYIQFFLYGYLTWKSIVNPKVAYFLRISEWSIIPLRLLVNPRQAILEFGWTATLLAKSHSNPNIQYIFEHTIILPLSLLRISSLGWKGKFFHTYLLIKRFAPQNPGLQDWIKPYVIARENPSLTKAALFVGLIRK